MGNLVIGLMLLFSLGGDFSTKEAEAYGKRMKIWSYDVEALVQYHDGNKETYQLRFDRGKYYVSRVITVKNADNTIRNSRSYEIANNDYCFRWFEGRKTVAIMYPKNSNHYKELKLIDIRHIGLNGGGLAGLAGQFNAVVIGHDFMKCDEKNLIEKGSSVILNYKRIRGNSVDVELDDKCNVVSIRSYNKNADVITEVLTKYIYVNELFIPIKTSYITNDKSSIIKEIVDIKWKSVNQEMDPSLFTEKCLNLPKMTVIDSNMPQHKGKYTLWDGSKIAILDFAPASVDSFSDRGGYSILFYLAILLAFISTGTFFFYFKINLIKKSNKVQIITDRRPSCENI
jgi:hypothetical protein